MQICSLLHEHVDNHSCTRFLKGNVDNKPLTNPHEVNAEGQFWGLEKVHSQGLNHSEERLLRCPKRRFFITARRLPYAVKGSSKRALVAVFYSQLRRNQREPK
jgi:hypothetical protein